MKYIYALKAGLFGAVNPETIPQVDFLTFGKNEAVALAASDFLTHHPTPSPRILKYPSPLLRTPLYSELVLHKETGHVKNGLGEEIPWVFNTWVEIKTEDYQIAVTDRDIPWKPNLLRMSASYSRSAVKGWARYAGWVVENIFRSIRDGNKVALLWRDPFIHLAMWYFEGCPDDILEDESLSHPEESWYARTLRPLQGVRFRQSKAGKIKFDGYQEHSLLPKYLTA